MLVSLQAIRSRRMLWSDAVIEINKWISNITSQNQLLTALKRQGGVDPDIFISRSNELAEQLRLAKQEKERLLCTADDETAAQTQELMDIIEAGPDFLTEFDAELFGELVEQVIVESNDRLRFRLRNGLELAAIRRADKAGPHQRTEVQKALQRLGCSNSTAFTEHQVLSILNRLIADPDQICLPETWPPDKSKLAELQLALKQELERQPVNEDAAKELAMARASAQYNAIGNQGYETERLRRLFRKLEPLSKLNADLLRSAISEIQIRRHKLNIRLRNGQIIEGGTII